MTYRTMIAGALILFGLSVPSVAMAVPDRAEEQKAWELERAATMWRVSGFGNLVLGGIGTYYTIKFNNACQGTGLCGTVLPYPVALMIVGFGFAAYSFHQAKAFQDRADELRGHALFRVDGRSVSLGVPTIGVDMQGRAHVSLVQGRF